MVFNLNAALEQAKKEIEDTSKLGLLLLAPSGGGKSTAIGTYGKKTLLLYGRGENHSPAAASLYGKDNVVPVCIDYADGQILNASQGLTRLSEILDSADQIKEAGFEMIAIDSATEIEALIKGSNKFANMVGGNKFKESDTTITLMREIILKLHDLQKTIGIDYVVSCPLDVKEVDSSTGEIIDSQPKLVGYRVAESLVQMFADVVVVGAMSNGAETQHRFQFAAGVSKDQKDQAGNIKRTVNFRPRLTGIDLREALPEHGTLPADLKELLKLKQGK